MSGSTKSFFRTTRMKQAGIIERSPRNTEKERRRKRRFFDFSSLPKSSSQIPAASDFPWQECYRPPSDFGPNPELQAASACGVFVQKVLALCGLTSRLACPRPRGPLLQRDGKSAVACSRRSDKGHHVIDRTKIMVKFGFRPLCRSFRPPA